MRKLRLMLVMATACGLVTFVALTFGQGSLTPPGAPAPTMKTLGEVEPRTPITNAPHTITQSGSYYLTTNLITTGHGIIIRADLVTLDLMGFSLTGDRGASNCGVWLDGATNAAVSDVVVHNGIIRGFGYGVYCDYGNNSRFERLLVSSNSNYGVFLYGYSGQCNGNNIVNCTITGNSNWGIYLYGGGSGQCDGNIIADCMVRENTDRGIFLSSADGNRIECNHVSVQTGSTTYGIRTSSTAQNLILHNTCVGQTTNFSISANDTYGPIVTNSGALSGTDPWANFSR